ncbi:protein LOW PSII ACCUMULATION 3, chloroplastic-like [Arachis ipaensis]|uniref:protein LOW PSII ACCUMULATION 3, chloroplastic-like n=1 Tax=Arachis ipaensis TaxID=130454 RepID=UPI000A2B7FEF|nr:protein LOW PSII ACCUMULATION 3, chloroplastic-like [Arachis ipaensis]
MAFVGCYISDSFHFGELVLNLQCRLGLLGFPPKDLYYRFLSQFTPVFYIRIREYSKTVAIAPYIVNYSGAVFRQYPSPWQVMLKQADGSYACIAESATRFTLGEASTWWEEDFDLEASSAWRS